MSESSKPGKERCQHRIADHSSQACPFTAGEAVAEPSRCEHGVVVDGVDCGLSKGERLAWRAELAEAQARCRQLEREIAEKDARHNEIRKLCEEANVHHPAMILRRAEKAAKEALALRELLRWVYERATAYDNATPDEPNRCPEIEALLSGVEHDPEAR